MGLITRVFEFDAAHRVMNERFKCYNLHGHRFKVELTFRYKDVPALGYAIDFKELKRVCGEYLDSRFDHAVILNPMDKELLCFVQNQGWRVYIMGLGHGDKDVNPSAENLSREIFTAVSLMFSEHLDGVSLERVRLYETPACYVDVDSSDVEGYFSPTETWRSEFIPWRLALGETSYDIREEL